MLYILYAYLKGHLFHTKNAIKNKEVLPQYVELAGGSLISGPLCLLQEKLVLTVKLYFVFLMLR